MIYIKDHRFWGCHWCWCHKPSALVILWLLDVLSSGASMPHMTCWDSWPWYGWIWLAKDSASDESGTELGVTGRSCWSLLPTGSHQSFVMSHSMICLDVLICIVLYCVRDRSFAIGHRLFLSFTYWYPSLRLRRHWADGQSRQCWQQQLRLGWSHV